MMRGQEEAPIELLIGVTVLTFVIIIGMYVFNNSCSTQQEQKLKASFSTLSSDLNYVYFGAKGTTRVSRFDFTNMEGCSSFSVDSVRLTKGTTATCMKQLGKTDCLVLVAVQKKTVGSTTTNYPIITEVLDIPSGISVSNLVSGSCVNDLNMIGYDLSSAANSGCWFGSNYYTIKITKVDNNRIVMDKL